MRGSQHYRLSSQMKRVQLHTGVALSRAVRYDVLSFFHGRQRITRKRHNDNRYSGALIGGAAGGAFAAVTPLAFRRSLVLEMACADPQACMR